MGNYILDDFKRKELFPIKITMFLIYGGQACLYPYLIVHLWSLKLGLEEITGILAIQPIIAYLSTLLVKAVAIRVSNVKALFCFSIILSVVVTNCLQLVPPIRDQFSDVQVRLNCTSNLTEGNVLQVLNKDGSCPFKTHLPDKFDETVQVKNCYNVTQSKSSRRPEFCFRNSTPDYTKCASLNSTLDIKIYGELIVTLAGNSTSASVRIQRVTFKNESYDSFFCTRFPNIEDGGIECEGTWKGNEKMCLGTKSSTSRRTTFWSYLGVRLSMTFFSALVISLFDVTSVSTLERVSGNLALQRLWASISVCVLAPIGGHLLDKTNHDKTTHDYSSVYYMYSVCYLTAALVSVFADSGLNKTHNPERKKWKAVLSDFEQLFLILTLFSLGVFWGYLDNFILWYMHSELGSDHLFMGLTVAVGTIACVPATPVLAWITTRAGYANVILLAVLAYLVKFVGYFLFESIYWCLALEVLDVFTISLLISGAVVCSTTIGATSTVTTTVALWNGAHFIIGRAVGTVIGGLASGRWGTNQACLGFAYASAIVTFLVCTTQAYLRWGEWAPKNSRDNDSGSPDSSEVEVREEASCIAGLSSLVLPFIESTGLSSFHVTSVLKGTRRPTLAEEVRRQSVITDDLHFFYYLGGGGSAAQRLRRKSFPSGARGSSGSLPRSRSRRASVANFRASLASVPEEETGSFTPEFSKRSVALSRSEAERLRPRGEPGGCENMAYQADMAT